MLRYYRAMADEEILSKHERENLLIKLDKEFAFAGAVIPAEIEAEDGPIPLRSFVFEMSKKRGRLTPEETTQVDNIIAIVRKKRREIVARIARDNMTVAEAKALYAAATGLDRALDTLYNAPEPRASLKDETNRARVEDGRRWLNLVRKVYTRDEKRKRD
jgi:hypothetical protein